MRGKLYFTKRWASEVKFRGRQYQQNDDWSDSQKTSIALQYEKRSKKSPSEFELRAEKKDKTYVSRLNGTRSSDSGQSLDDRYDYNQLNLAWSQQHQVVRDLAWQYELQYKQKNYQDFDKLNITDLDYQSVTLGNAFVNTISNRQKDKFSLDLTYRLYNYRVQKDIDGVNTPDTQLGYYDATLAYKHTLKTSKRHKLAMKLAYEKRVDNGSGYDNTHRAKFELQSHYRINRKASFGASYQFSDYAYDRETIQDPSNPTDEYTANQKHQIKLNGKVNLKPYLSMNVHWLMAYRFEQVEADKVQYSYERHQVETGLKFEF